MAAVAMGNGDGLCRGGLGTAYCGIFWVLPRVQRPRCETHPVGHQRPVLETGSGSGRGGALTVFIRANGMNGLLWWCLVSSHSFSVRGMGLTTDIGM